MEDILLKKEGASARIALLGGMITVSFPIGGRVVEPLYVHPWEPEDTDDPFLGRLQGDFFCLPFGMAPSAPLPGDWPVGSPPRRRPYPHGFSASGRYRVCEQWEDRAVIALSYDGDEAIDRVERDIRLERQRLVVSDRVFMKQAARLPVGIHPIFRLPETPGGARVLLPDHEGIYTYPTAVDDSAVFVLSAFFRDPARVPLRAGGTLDATRLPLPVKTEELLFLAGVREGRVSLQNREEHYTATLEWDTAGYPNCLLWLSNRGRGFSPWNGRNLCLGIEPVASAFDLGEAMSCAENPLSRRGVSTAYPFLKETPAVFTHAITVREGA